MFLISKFFSFVDLKIYEIPAKEKPQDSISYEGKWDQYRPGGSLLSEFFINNPQFRLSIDEEMVLQIKAVSAPNLKIMLMLIDSGKEITELDFQEIVANKNPGFYNYGFTYMEAKLSPGKYTIILCPFTQQNQVLAPFDIFRMDLIQLR